MDEENQGGLSAAVPVEPPPVPAKPPVSPFGDMDELAKARASLMAQQQRLMADLEERSKPQPADFWAALARGFSSPDSKLFSQGMGAAAGELQRTNELQSAKDLQVGQMRMAIAKQQYDLSKQDALGRMIQAGLGGGNQSPVELAQAAPGAAPQPGQRGAAQVRSPQDTRWLTVLGMTDPEEAIKKLAEVETKNMQLPEEIKTLNAALAAMPDDRSRKDAMLVWANTKARGDTGAAFEQITKLGAARRAGTITDAIYDAGVNNILSNIGIQPTAVAPQKEVRLSAADEKSAAALMNQLEQLGIKGSVGVGYVPKESTAAKSLPQLSPAEQAGLEVKRREAEMAEETKAREKREEPFSAKYTMLSGYDANTVGLNKVKLGELSRLVKANPEVVGLLVHQGPMYAMLQAAEGGVQTPIGSLSVPVTESLAKLKLSPEKQAVARNVAQLISDLNQTIMKEGKSIYGPQISVFDAQKMAEPGFKSTDPAAFIMYLAAKQTVTNKFLGDMNEAMNAYYEQNPKASTKSFFTSKPYKEIVEQFHATYRDLVNRSPIK